MGTTISSVGKSLIGKKPWSSSSPSLSAMKVRITEVVDDVCDEYQLKIVDIGRRRRIRDIPKWTFNVVRLKDGTSAILELFYGPVDSIRDRIEHKWLNGEYFHQFSIHCVREPDVHCFLYDNDKNVQDIVYGSHSQSDKPNVLSLGYAREKLISGYVEDILSALLELNDHGLHHSRLGWDIVHVSAVDNRARLGMLEWVVDSATVQRRPFDHVAELRHAPPETFGRRWISRDSNKFVSWIVGSLLLDILVRKQISGPEFRVVRTSLTPTLAVHNIKTNESKLIGILWDFDLSSTMKTLIVEMLCVDPELRINLKEAISHMTQDEKPATTRFSRNLDQPPTRKSGSVGTKSNKVRPWETNTTSETTKPTMQSSPKWSSFCCSNTLSTPDVDIDNDNQRHLENQENVYVPANDDYDNNDDYQYNEVQDQPIIEEPDDYDHTITVNQLDKRGPSCILHWPNNQWSGVNEKKLKITINVQQDNNDISA